MFFSSMAKLHINVFILLKCHHSLDDIFKDSLFKVGENSGNLELGGQYGDEFYFREMWSQI